MINVLKGAKTTPRKENAAVTQAQEDGIKELCYGDVIKLQMWDSLSASLELIVQNNVQSNAIFREEKSSKFFFKGFY